ncbi:hypothetical protein GCM10010988_18700 [Cnuibacter physcomitrellae]|uniref:Uncharacterized protein n=1 Tax=Cnuibacter physcomitrellae TaxID=1619308 RepID=A0A1X9LN06_9MICO|nr:hypothetical protein [Cnuibacter physcomitrellae]ARJ06595.1 hypothetical protein B5808_16220 [Cnuibacter physcomitrellae]GGI38379.1 hypothetical protein GCM10010988_18700 [Cnuibacter physcomitrellae]
MTDDRIHDLEPGVGGGTGATTNPGPGHLPHNGRSAAELAPESAAEGYGPAVTPAADADADGAVAPASVDPDAAAAAPAVGEDADAPGSDDERTPGLDEVPGPHGVDDPDQNPPLPDWGPTDGTHGEG